MKVFDLAITRKGDESDDLKFVLTEDQYINMIKTIQAGNALVCVTDEGASIFEGGTIINFTDVSVARAKARVVDISAPQPTIAN